MNLRFGQDSVGTALLCSVWCQLGRLDSWGIPDGWDLEIPEGWFTHLSGV